MSGWIIPHLVFAIGFLLLAWHVHTQ